MPNFIEEIIVQDMTSGKHSSIVVRFPPEPNGYLHIGHAKAICLNVSIANKYNGICNLRFDDTNPTTENIEYVNAIIRDMQWLGWSGNIYFASDYFDTMIETAFRLIRSGKAYVDSCTPQQIKTMRGTLTAKGTDSPYRNRSIADNAKIFEDMIEGRYKDGQAVLRAKIDMSSPNINMRDPILYRVVHARHHRQGDKYKVYPMYDFAHPIEDAIEGVTHSCCSLEFEDHRPLYDWVLRESGGFKEPLPTQYEFARLNIEGINLSKRYLRTLVQDGLVSSWDDPRMPTLSGLQRRGYSASSLIEFCDRIGVSKSNSTVDYSFLESCARDELNNTATRVMCAIDPIQLHIVNRPDTWQEEVEFVSDVGDQRRSRSMVLTNRLYIDKLDFSVDPPPRYKRLVLGGYVRLKGGYIVKCIDHVSTGDKAVVRCEIVQNSKSGQDTSGIKGAGVIHWVSQAHSVDIVVRQFGKLYVDNQFNHNSMIEKPARIELEALSMTGPFQFLRNGYYCFDTVNGCIDKNACNEIVGLKDGFGK